MTVVSSKLDTEIFFDYTAIEVASHLKRLQIVLLIIHTHVDCEPCFVFKFLNQWGASIRASVVVIHPRSLRRPKQGSAWTSTKKRRWWPLHPFLPISLRQHFWSKVDTHVLLFASYSLSHIHYKNILNIICPQHYPIMRTFIYLLAFFYLAHALPAFSIMGGIWKRKRPTNIGEQTLSINPREPSRLAGHKISRGSVYSPYMSHAQSQFKLDKVQSSSRLTAQSEPTPELTPPRRVYQPFGTVQDGCRKTQFPPRDPREKEKLLERLQKQHTESNGALNRNESLPCPKQAKLKPIDHDEFTPIDFKDALVESAAPLTRVKSWSPLDPDRRRPDTQNIPEWDDPEDPSSLTGKPKVVLNAFKLW